MNEGDVRALYFRQLVACGEDTLEAAAATRLAAAKTILAGIRLHSRDERFMETVIKAVQLKTDLLRKEMYLGPAGLDQVPFDDKDEAVLYRVLDAERDILTYLRDHRGTLPASNLRESLTPAVLTTALATRRTERERIGREFNTRQHAWVRRDTLAGLAANTDNLVQALIGEEACERFRREFDQACGWIGLELDRPKGKVH